MKEAYQCDECGESIDTKPRWYHGDPYHKDCLYATDGGVDQDDGETDRHQCDNPLCEETLTVDPDSREGYCSWDCAVMAREGVADRILRERGEDRAA